MADLHAEQHQAKSVLGKGRKAEIDPVAFGDPGHRKVRRGADQGTIAAEAGAERQPMIEPFITPSARRRLDHRLQIIEPLARSKSAAMER
jgi:hypothetical protein